MAKASNELPWIDRGRYAYPLYFAIGVLLWYALYGCATPNPPKTFYVQWNAAPCDAAPIMRRVQFVDTWAPTISCIQAGSKSDAARLIVLTLIGMPVVACAVTEYNVDPQEIRTEFTTVYAPISPSFTQVASTALTFASPETVLLHEIEHAFGKSGDHSGACREQIGSRH